MAIIAPFRGLYYNPAKVPNLTEVVTPPYDVIRPAEREVFAARHPNNMVHLILPQPAPGDDRLANRYTRAGALFRQWEKDEVLVRDQAPAFYYWETEFQHAGRAYTRSALAALVRLEPLSGGGIRPHEQTFSAAKADRLALLVGAEGSGLSDEASSWADHHVRIPIRPEADSLNLAVATGIALSRLTGAARSS